MAGLPIGYGRHPADQPLYSPTVRLFQRWSGPSRPVRSPRRGQENRQRFVDPHVSRCLCSRIVTSLMGAEAVRRRAQPTESDCRWSRCGSTARTEWLCPGTARDRDLLVRECAFTDITCDPIQFLQHPGDRPCARLPGDESGRDAPGAGSRSPPREARGRSRGGTTHRAGPSEEFDPIFDRIVGSRLRGAGRLRRLIEARQPEAFAVDSTYLERLLGGICRTRGSPLRPASPRCRSTVGNHESMPICRTGGWSSRPTADDGMHVKQTSNATSSVTMLSPPRGSWFFDSHIGCSNRIRASVCRRFCGPDLTGVHCVPEFGTARTSDEERVSPPAVESVLRQGSGHRDRSEVACRSPWGG